MYIKENWNEYEKRKNEAANHTEDMERRFKGETEFSVEIATVHDMIELPNGRTADGELNICVCDIDSVSAIFEHQAKKTAVLNFASFKKPGGRFLDGAMSQEECLCHASNLYNVLSRFEDSYYEWNKKHLNQTLYLNRALYTEDIVFVSKRGETTTCDVINCAAPNKPAAQKYYNVSDKENTEALSSRIQFILSVAQKHRVKTLILGAYGCGVFGQDPKEVASLFKQHLQSIPWGFDKVIFAIPNGKNRNYSEFAKIFQEDESENAKLEEKSETEFYVVVADSCGMRKYVSRSFPKTFPYTVKLSKALRFLRKEDAEEFIENFNSSERYSIQNPDIKTVVRTLKIM